MRRSVRGKVIFSTLLPSKLFWTNGLQALVQQHLFKFVTVAKSVSPQRLQPVRSAEVRYLRRLHSSKARSEISLTLAGSTSLLIPERQKQRCFSIFSPSLSLTEKMFVFISNAFMQMVVTVPGKYKFVLVCCE